MRSIRSLIRHWFGGSASQDSWVKEVAAQDRADARFRAVVDSGGWRSWIYNPPPHDCLVEWMREGDERIRALIPRQASPEWNVWGVYWRPARPAIEQYAPFDEDGPQALGEGSSARKPDDMVSPQGQGGEGR